MANMVIMADEVEKLTNNAPILQMVILCGGSYYGGSFFRIYIIHVMWSLCEWIYWEDGFVMWLRRRYMLSRLSVNMTVSIYVWMNRLYYRFFCNQVFICYMLCG